MKQKCNLVVALSVALSVFAAQAAVRQWTGAGDGVNFSDSRNWDGAVQAGDALVIENATADTVLALTNDLGSASDPFRLECITAVGAGTVRIGGNPIEASGGVTTNIHAGCALITDFDIVYPNHSSKTYVYCYVTNGMVWTHNGSISAPGKTSLRLATCTGAFHIYGDVSFTNGAITAYGVDGNQSYGHNSARWYFYGKCSTPKFNADGKWLARGATYHAYSGYDVDVFSMRCANDYLSAPNIFKSTTVVESFTSAGDGNLYIQGNDQTIDHLAIGYYSSIATKDKSGHSISGTGSTFTMKSSADNTTNDFRFVSSVNAVWDPLGDYTCFFLERTHTTSGRITVKRGTMAFLGATEFSALSEIEIAAGAKFSLAETTTASPFAALQYIWLDNDTTAVIALPEGCSISASVMAGNVLLSPGTYTGQGGTADHVVDWIEGKGVVTVVAPEVRRFTSTVSSRWGDPRNWSDGRLPTNDVETVIARANVTVPPADTIFYDLTSFAAYNASPVPPSFTVHRGGSLTISGGSLVITNISGSACVGGDSSITSRIDVVDGFLGLYAAARCQRSFVISQGGVFSMTGGRAEYRYDHWNNSNGEWMFRMTGGLLDLSNDSELDIWISGNPALVFGTGTVNVRGNAYLWLKNSGNPRSRWTPAAENEILTVNLSDNARYRSAYNVDFIGGYFAGARTVVNVSGNATMSFGSQLTIGYGGGAGGEMNISGNAVVSNQTNYGISIGVSGTLEKPSSGKIRMTGGLVRALANSNASTFGGLTIGQDNATEFTNVYNRGSFEMSGGTVTNNANAYNRLIMGAGNSHGEMLQSGGSFVQGKGVVRVGWRGGIGLYRFTGGTADFSNCDFHVGLDGGKGTLEIGAGTGTLTSKNLFFDGEDAVLKFKPGANGSLARLNVTTMFTVVEGAKLVVDASEYVGIRPVDLMTFAAKNGEFAEENVEIIAPKPSQFKVQQQATRIRLVVRKGFMMSVK